MGFDYFYGYMGGETDQWTPYLFQRSYPNFSVDRASRLQPHHDMADEAIKYMHVLNASAPDKPFFVYYVPGGTHSPHQPTKEWIAKFKGKFDMGYEKLREQIFENQKKLGVIPPDTQLTPWPDGRMHMVGRSYPGGIHFPLCKKSFTRVRLKSSPPMRPYTGL